MKVVGLVSGGKDSCYAMMKCIEYGHEIVAVANLLPAEDSVDELDSYMYQTVGHQIVVSYAECMGVPLFRKRIQGTTRHHNLSYKVTPGDEVEDLFILLNEVKKQIPLIEGVSSGAIASDYQRLRVESVCSRLGLISLAFLWKQDQSLLLQEMIRKSIKAIIVKVAAIGLEPKKHLGKEIVHLESYLHKLKELYGINVCGEGGEYETLTLDCPLFKNAQIVLDEFDIVLHSADSIASVGILHPSAFHLEYKQETEPLCDSDGSIGIFRGNNVTVFEVQGDCLQSCEVECSAIDQSLDVPAVTNYRLHTSKTRKDDIFTISCCLLNPCKTSADLQEHLKALLTKVELQLVECGFSWESVLYIHLYISDMNAFASANATYVSYITHEKCRFGVPSRSTIELPLSEVGLGSAYIEVLVANDQTKRVLHVQSISCWAPSCIGPYSQATLHKEILYMAGQLGLDPPTMLLRGGGPIAELKQALQNSEAVAQSFRCSVSTSAIFLIIYCSKSIPHTERNAMNDELQAFLKTTKLLCSRSKNKSELLGPIILYVLVPDLPKRAFVEVKPVLYVAEDTETSPDAVTEDLCCDTTKTYWGFHPEHWHESCFQKCIVAEKICAVVLSVTGEIAQKICSEPAETNLKRINRVAQFCIVLINKILSENHFSWGDITNLRFHYPTSLQISHESLTQIFMGVFRDFATMNQSIQIGGGEPIFNLIPVLGAGMSPASMEDILTCELLAQKS